MAMYYYASKLNEASCSGCNVKVPPAPSEPAPVPPPPTEHAPLPPDSSILHGTGLSYYDNDDYYSMVRGNKFMTENTSTLPSNKSVIEKTKFYRKKYLLFLSNILSANGSIKVIVVSNESYFFVECNRTLNMKILSFKTQQFEKIHIT